MKITKETRIDELVAQFPECREYLWPFRDAITSGMRLEQLSSRYFFPVKAFEAGLKSRIGQHNQVSEGYKKIRQNIVKSSCINIAGFVNEKWRGSLTDELNRFAQSQHISLNINLLPKNKKQDFAHYISVCTNPDDMPDILIGKGFGTLMSQRFNQLFIKTGVYQKRLNVGYNSLFQSADLIDVEQNYHPFALEEYLMAFHNYDQMLCPPTSWFDILQPGYRGKITQMSESKSDKFCFVMLFYLYKKYGEEGIIRYASNVNRSCALDQIQQEMISNMNGTSLTTMYAHGFHRIQSMAEFNTREIIPMDGNPVTLNFLLVKQQADEQADMMARHFYSPQVGAIIESSGLIHAGTHSLKAGSRNVRWLGWDTIKNAPLPFLKDYLNVLAMQGTKVKVKNIMSK